jgi:hypothetical protein
MTHRAAGTCWRLVGSIPPHKPSPEPLAHGARTVGIAGVEGLTGLQEHHPGLLIGDRAVANPSRDYEQFAWSEDDVVLVFEADAQLTSVTRKNSSVPSC